ncbi:YheC/YheD family protein [Paenibacillus sp. IB182496]|uniref:YheC/YheD family protein n=1 Tax=Paenibacillus sabuli TaxID=2772509 RepID=A0A927BV07_9BACL|nr:YheC/YheD family protein [Paenibacillus sabuli]MBD2847347.1 YheC/YheD family protein [Paenibacillus sabuli]
MPYSLSKLSKHKLLLGVPQLASALPPTAPLGREALSEMLERYEKLIVKPSLGSGGKGVRMVARDGSGYRVQSGTRSRRFGSRDALYAHLLAGMGSAKGMIQRRIPLATIEGRPFDLRVMVQRKSGGDWTVTGALAKVAGAGYIITNLARSGGRILTVSEAVRRSNIAGVGTDRIQAELVRLALASASRLRTRYNWIRTVGLDIGLDSSGKAWIIECNFSPANSLFNRLRDKTMYRRILSYSKRA